MRTEVGGSALVAVVMVAAFVGAFVGQVFYKVWEARIFRARFARLDAKYGLSDGEKAKMESALRV